MSGSVLHKNHNHLLPNFRVIALCYFSYWNFVWNISQCLQKISALKLKGCIDLIEKKCTAQEP